MGRIYCRKKVEGVELPAIIHNSGYFLIHMGVYEDGTVSCWHKSDMSQFREDLKKGWIVPSTPDDQWISVQGLGQYQVAQARWLFDAKRYYARVQELLKQMNPELSNLYHTTQREIDKWNARRVSWTAEPVPFKLQGDIGYSMEDGKTMYLFYRDNTRQIHLTGVTVYSDKTLQIGCMGDEYLTEEQMRQLFEQKILCTEPQPGEWVRIDGLGDFLPAEMEQGAEAGEKCRELSELMKQLAGEKDAHDQCLAAHYQYLIDPCQWTREALRQAYEAVPEHKRIYLGNMDDRDSDFIRILYHPDEKRQV